MEILKSFADRKRRLSDSLANMRKGLRLAQLDYLDGRLEAGYSSNRGDSAVTVTPSREGKRIEIWYPAAESDDDGHIHSTIDVLRDETGALLSVRVHREEGDNRGLIGEGDYCINTWEPPVEHGLSGSQTASILHSAARFQDKYPPVPQQTWE